MGHIAIAPRIEIGPPDEHHPVEQVEQPHHVILVFERGENHWNAPRGGNAVEISGGDERQGGVLLTGWTVVGVDADEWFGCHGIPLDTRGADTFQQFARGVVDATPGLPAWLDPPPSSPKAG